MGTKAKIHYKEPYFAKIDFGHGPFRTAYVDIALYDPRKREDVDSVSVFSSGWTNATYWQVETDMQTVVDCLGGILSLTDFRSYRRAGSYAWVKKHAYLSKDHFRAWAEKIAARANECLAEMREDKLKNEIFGEDDTED
jgi:hypothetical protein